jgi:hypothetical protein
MIFVVRTMNLRLIREIGWREIMRKLTMLGIIGGAALLTGDAHLASMVARKECDRNA